MSIVNIPVIAYIDGGTRQLNNQIIADDNAYQALYAKWTEIHQPSSTHEIIQRWQNINYTPEQARNAVNDFLNSYILSDKLDFYLANTLAPGTDISDLLHDLSVFGIVPTIFSQTTNEVTRLVTLDNVDLIDETYTMGTITYWGDTHQCLIQNVPNFFFATMSADSRYSTVEYNLQIFPSDIFTGNAVTGGNYSDATDPVFLIQIEMGLNGDDTIGGIIIKFYGWQKLNGFANLVDKYDGVNINTPGTVIDDVDNPYGYEGTSGPGGGNGKYGDIDGIEATDVPDLPTVNAASLGLITLYNPSAATINSLASFLWSGMFDPDSFKKIYGDPMGCMIGLSVVPAIPSTGGTKNIMFGNVDSGISCSYLSSNYVNVDCGSVAVDEYVGSFLDYEPYCKLNLFLPYVGFVPLAADDIVGGSINVQYNVDVLSGHCVAFVKHSTKGVLYSYSGSCITNIPLTAQSFTSALQSYYTGLAGIAASAISSLGTGGAGLCQTAAEVVKFSMDTMFNSKPTFQRSGSIGGASAIMGVQKPFIVIQRPRFSVPNEVTKYVGLTSNMTRQLAGCHGFTMVEYVHIQGIPATSEEIAEIESLLKEGVIL